MKSTREIVISQIENFMRLSCISEREFGMRALNDNKFVPRLRKGAGVTLTSIEKAERFMRDNPPVENLSQPVGENHVPKE